MNPQTTHIPQEEIDRQLALCAEIRRLYADRGETPLAFVDTYGCQQNEADSERIRGYLRKMGFDFTQEEKNADVIVINTCAVREHAEQRVFGNVGALIHTKRARPDQIICLCGCMVQQPHVAEKIRQSFRHVDLVFGPQVLWKFPSFLYELLSHRGRIFQIPDEAGSIAEGIPVVRQGAVKAWVSVMYGCNNFCTYCIVPHVRGRERSREPEEILAEVRRLVDDGYKDITLLGQNVNSYSGGGMDFPALLRAVNDIPGEFLIRFMTSHPKDATEELFRAMAGCGKVAPVLHLPFQAGSDRVLQAMNRRHTAAQYLDKVRALRALIPDVVLTSDVIVGFPGETTEEFEQTLRIVEEVRYDALFTFIYSPREGTPAARLPDPMSREEKLANFNRLVALQDAISEEKHAAYLGKTVRCLVDGASDDPRWPLTARTPGNRLVRLDGGPEQIGAFRDVVITEANKWSLCGRIL